MPNSHMRACHQITLHLRLCHRSSKGTVSPHSVIPMLLQLASKAFFVPSLAILLLPQFPRVPMSCALSLLCTTLLELACQEPLPLFPFRLRAPCGVPLVARLPPEFPTSSNSSHCVLSNAGSLVVRPLLHNSLLCTP